LNGIMILCTSVGILLLYSSNFPQQTGVSCFSRPSTLKTERIAHDGIQRRDCAWLKSFEANQEKIYSQGVQDGILRHIFTHLGTTNKIFAEFGFGYSEEITKEVYDNMLLNTANLRYAGWQGVYFDAILESKEFNVRKATLTSENIVSHFLDAGIPYDVDYVSIDVDSIDIWLLKSILESCYWPRVISVEYNVHFAPDMLISMENKWHPWTQRNIYGASAAAINYLAALHNYTTVHIMENSLDMFLVRNDLLEGCEATPFHDLAVGKMPASVHEACIEEDIARIVDVPSILSYPDDYESANNNARDALIRLRTHYNMNICKI
jgi:hypothetical protein